MAKTESTMQRKHAYAHILCIIASKMGKKSFTVAEVAEKINFPSFVGRGKSGMSPRIRSALAFGRSEDIGVVSVRKNKGKNRYSLESGCRPKLKRMFSDIGKNYNDVNSFRKAQKKMSLANKFSDHTNSLRDRDDLSSVMKRAYKREAKIKKFIKASEVDYFVKKTVKMLKEKGGSAKFDKMIDELLALHILALKAKNASEKAKLKKRFSNSLKKALGLKKDPGISKTKKYSAKITKSNPPKRRRKATSKRKTVKRKSKKTIRSVKRNPPKRRRKVTRKSSASKRKVTRRKSVAKRKTTRRKTTPKRRVVRKTARRSVKKSRR